MKIAIKIAACAVALVTLAGCTVGSAGNTHSPSPSRKSTSSAAPTTPAPKATPTVHPTPRRTTSPPVATFPAAGAIAARARCVNIRSVSRKYSSEAVTCDLAGLPAELATFTTNALRDKYIAAQHALLPDEAIVDGHLWAAVMNGGSANNLVPFNGHAVWLGPGNA